MEKRAQDVMLAAFEDELTKLAHGRELTELEKQAFIGKALKAVGKFFGRGKPSGAAKVTKAVRAKANPASGEKFVSGVGRVSRGASTQMRTARGGGFRATRGGGARTGRYTAGIAPNLQKMAESTLRERLERATRLTKMRRLPR